MSAGACPPLTPTLQRAALLWDYLSSGRSRAPCDVMVLCGSYDLRVVDYACGLLAEAYAPKLLISGDRGRWTRELWTRPEAEIFAERALALGVPAENILLEPRAANFAENLRFARELCPDARSVLLVTKPQSLRRVLHTQPLCWPEIVCHVDAPDWRFPEDASPVVGIFGWIEEMVGDLHRMLRYPRLGLQTPAKVPPAVLEAWQGLVAQGYNRQLLPGSALDDLPRPD
ncbi:YdcF family protein [uncultured Aquitalea sp.]|uniref:YdcF family protein n=1 Tax=uncultured Aquitalea sp. TaxID=540272 RepID=UPI0025CBAC40|nr:YdcF family protein [uncultured Aquitalea sp.]